MTAAWRLAKQPGSLSGVPFYVDRAVTSGLGREVVVHRFAKRDGTEPEDMGQQEITYSFDAYVIGDDYMKQRDALTEKLRQKGAQELVHPWDGRMMVHITSGICTQSVEHGGEAKFQITFTLARLDDQPVSVPNTQARVEGACTSAGVACSADFSRSHDVAHQPDFVRTAALDDVRAALSSVESEIRKLVPDTGQLGTFVSEAAATSTQLASMIGSPTRVADELTWQVSRLGVVAQAPGDAFDSLKTLFNWGDDLDTDENSTALRRRQTENRKATRSLVRRTALLEAAQAASVTTFDSSNDALAARALLTQAIDSEMADAGDDVYRALADVRVAVVRDLTTRGAQLPRVRKITLKATIPAALLAYQLYGDVERSDEIVTRNKIRNPFFVPGGVELEVLEDA